VVQQARAEDAEAVRTAYVAAGITAEVAPFFADIPRHLAAAHLVIARAGASTTAELAVAGRPAILVPLPNAIDDHQSANAAALAEAGAAWVMPQPGFTAEALGVRLAGLLRDPVALAAAAAAARGQGRVAAVDALADLVERSIVRETQS
jgi:UDP-N-acetylglucosamine--N-acetylmuramyl-(pentapeptide) pyrophosphoryl-undecaprenol N-acetylglucosamine transferase